jgi:hypothetical protein
MATLPDYLSGRYDLDEIMVPSRRDVARAGWAALKETPDPADVRRWRWRLGVLAPIIFLVVLVLVDQVK